MRAARDPRVFFKKLEQHTGRKNVVAHRGVDAFGIARYRRSVWILLMERENVAVRRGFDDAEFDGVDFRNRNRRDCDISAPLHMELDHAGDVHAVDVVAAEDRDYVRVGLLHEVDVLIDGVGGALVPSLSGRAHLRGYRNHELILEEATELPAFVDVLQQGLAAELCQYIYGMDPRVNKITQDEIDNPVFAAEWNSRLGAFARQWVKAGTLSAGENNAQHADIHRMECL